MTAAGGVRTGAGTGVTQEEARSPRVQEALEARRAQKQIFPGSLQKELAVRSVKCQKALSDF